MPTLNKPQSRFFQLKTKFRAYVAGYGSGKTWAGCASLCEHALKWPKVTAGYFAPTYPQIRDIFYPTIEEVAYDWGMTTKIKTSDKEVDMYIAGRYRGTIICRSMEKPETIVGFKIGLALLDEIDTLKTEKAAIIYRKVIGRMRFNVDGLRNGIDVTTTPEGFRWTYQQFVERPLARPEMKLTHGMIQASTYDNEANLPEDYIPTIKQEYPESHIEAYLNGKFVNLATGTVYRNFDRTKNACDTQIIKKDGKVAEQLHIGMDFNVYNMHAAVHVLRGNDLHLAEEICGAVDTEDMCSIIKSRYGTVGVIVYPDASGAQHHSNNVNQTDIEIIKKYGFQVVVNPSNPSVKDRIQSVNAMILNGEGKRRFYVNVKNCPKATSALEKQAYTISGEPDKSSGHDHLNDCVGYVVVKLFPIRAHKARVTSIG